MVILELREKLPPDSIVFDNQSYDRSIIGTTLDGRVIYDYNLMVVEYMADNECDEEAAVDWIDYNTLRSIPYAGDRAPLVVTSLVDHM